MNSAGTDGPFGWLGEWGWLVDWLGTAVLVFLVFGAIAVMALFHVAGQGIDRLLDESVVPLRVHIDLVAIPLAAVAAAWLRWGADWITAPLAPRAIRARSHPSRIGQRRVGASE